MGCEVEDLKGGKVRVNRNLAHNKRKARVQDASTGQMR